MAPKKARKPCTQIQVASAAMYGVITLSELTLSQQHVKQHMARVYERLVAPSDALVVQALLCFGTNF